VLADDDMTTILGIETSCDETAAAVVDDGRVVRSHLLATQFDLHEKYGGVVPEIASRAHIERLDPLIDEAMQQAGATPDDIDAIAVTHCPGLIGSLLVGVTAAKTLAWAWGKPLVGVNHLHAHATSAAIDLPPRAGSAPWPAVALVVSGGHTSLGYQTPAAYAARCRATESGAPPPNPRLLSPPRCAERQMRRDVELAPTLITTGT
jgi:N6-L-threonylcarbamoyladenine synthase